ncbi:uncharacterized protein BT62DRAFT_83715 [Guyanagaster necrorhizus]|uniref:Uncharacterized protein n=1 Tax=Guyanagaster necrorhizus TaxID=856835 RepID=A0A9P7VV51_9AGAR|nr:uncharacterized protein BT62DRAFT_83715 [Guyanagaster necrorhizus MCA 3950]KAG7446729.1 hypothetical protein BT62DRAFT_83715 [Guyanagaster necrorhizus MCA 3950]
MSTDTVISERATHLDLHEPDDQWEAELKEKLSVAFNDMLRQAKQKLEDDLNSLGGDNIDAAQKKKLIGEYQASERQIKSYATQSFRFEVEKEREQRRWAAGLEMRTGWKEDLENEQMAIMSGIRRQRTGSAGAESNANPKGRDRESTQPDRLSDSRQQTTTTTTTPTPSATRPSPIPIPTVQRRSSTSGTPVNSVPKNPEVWIPPKSAAEDKPNLLGRRTSQASIRTSPSQNFRPSAPIPENQKPSSNTDSRSSSSHVSKACAPLPEIPKDTATENDHSESRTASSQTSRPSVSTLENRNHYGNLDRDSRSSPSYTLRSENNRRSIPEHDSVEHQTTTTGPVIPIHEHANAEREKARMAEADQLWASHTRAKGKEIEIERDRPSSPLLRSVSNQDVGPPPPPPIATKPVYTPHPSLLTTSRPSSTASSHPPATLYHPFLTVLLPIASLLSIRLPPLRIVNLPSTHLPPP